jgi:hypothetical protein
MDGSKSIGNGRNEYLPLAINEDNECLSPQEQWTKSKHFSFHLAHGAFDISFHQPLLFL